MKKAFLVIVMFASVNVFAQNEYKKFRVDVGLGYAIPKGGGGILLYLEPKYAIIPSKLSLGIRFESAALAKEITSGTNASLASTISYLATGDYHLTKTTARPFVGIGLGFFGISSLNYSYTDPSSGASVSLPVSESSTKFGGMIRAGLDVTHFRVAFEYNLVPSTSLTTDASINNSYIGIKIGGYFGGGKKK